MGSLVLSEPYYQGVDTSSADESLTLNATTALQQIISNIGSGGYSLTVNYGTNSVILQDGTNIWVMYDGVDWRNKDITYSASSIEYTPTTPLTATNIQDALDEVATELTELDAKIASPTKAGCLLDIDGSGFVEDENIIDQSGTQDPASTTDITSIGSEYGQLLHFNSSSSFIEYDNNVVGITGTFRFIMQNFDSVNEEYILDNRDSSLDSGMFIEKTTSNTFQFSLYGATTNDTFDTGIDISSNDIITVVVSDSLMSAYAGGELIATQDVTCTPVVSINPLFIGCKYDGTLFADGDMAFYYTTEEWTADEVKSDANISTQQNNIPMSQTNTPNSLVIRTDDGSVIGTTYRPTTLDISTADQTTDLDQYLDSGTDPKPDGWKILVSWSGGDSTYSHCFTSTYNLKNQFVDKAVGDNSTTYAWCGYGTGGLFVEKDEANSCWRVLTYGAFDEGTGPNGDIWSQYTDFTCKETFLISGTASTSAGGAWWYSKTWTYVIPLSSYSCFSATGSNYALGSTSSISETVMIGKLGRMDGTDVSVSGCLSVCGVSRD